MKESRQVRRQDWGFHLHNSTEGKTELTTHAGEICTNNILGQDARTPYPDPFSLLTRNFRAQLLIYNRQEFVLYDS